MTSLAESAPALGAQHLAHTKYRPDIDGLRAIAVLSVVAFHAFPELFAGGFIGVDIFFVISGYLISTILMKSVNQGTFSIGEFYSRRVNRIFPALILVMICCYVFGWLSMFTDEFQQLGKHIAGGAAFVSNLVLFNESGYFDTSAEIKPFLHLWSLGIEEQYYILWPLIIWAAWKRNINLLGVAVLLFVASFVANIMNVRESPSYTFYLPHTRVWELLIGSILAYAHCFPSRGFKKTAAISNTMSAVGLALIAYGLFTITKVDQFPGWVALYPTVGSALVIGAGPTALLNRYVIGNRMFVWVGLISFPLYLWHWPLLTFARIVENGPPPEGLRFILVAASVLLAWVTYFFVEKPIRNNRNRTTTTALCLTMTAVAVIGFLTYQNNGLPWRPSIQKTIAVQEQFVGTTWKYSTNDICLNRYPFEERKDYGYWFCITNKDSNPTILIFGNSYANHLYPGFANNKNLESNTVLNVGACGVGSPAYSDKTILGGNEPCTGYRPEHQENLIFDIIDKSKTVKYAIVDGLINTPYGEFYIDLVEKRIARLLEKNVKVVIFVPHMTFNVDIKTCFTRPLFSGINDGCSVPIEKKKEVDDRFKPMMDAILAKHPSVKFFDQNKLICDSTKCSMVIDGMPMYRDQAYHYSEYASQKISESFVRWAKDNAPDILNP
ncbi:acyltransferase [Pseudomonas sp. MF5691]|uniref:acyltransferase family protein n=1 Tax=Pseudomonas sp. MF5691 TaxID=2797526 RepID=UPI0018E843E6|nr:acyltransferase family protein [Pseudomonas sp. MF5691]MBJ2290756.1 acyltransferase [Pseudomonas sp. MF5691]